MTNTIRSNSIKGPVSGNTNAFVLCLAEVKGTPSCLGEHQADPTHMGNPPIHYMSDAGCRSMMSNIQVASNTMRLDVGENRAAVTYKATILSPEQLRQDAECSLAYVTSLIRELSGVEFKPLFVEFEHSRPKSVSRHRQLFGCEVAFGQKSNRLHLDKRMLDTPVLSSDSGLLQALRFYLDDKIKVRSETEDLIAKIRHLISSSLVNGVPDQKRIADQLGMSARTLQRRLRDKEVVFADLVDEVRYEIAQDYVSHSEFSITDVSMMLGYNELSSFSRAFKRWSGVSPHQLRESAKKSAPGA